MLDILSLENCKLGGEVFKLRYGASTQSLFLIEVMLRSGFLRVKKLSTAFEEK
jgi:hypothetical protein